ncbi:MAG: hypothetical protein ACQER9_04050 [Nanobdellota archaeon]
MKCDVCKKETINFSKTEGTVFCSKECQKIHRETMNNIVKTCFYCGKKTEGYKGLVELDYKNKKAFLICKDCA